MADFSETENRPSSRTDADIKAEPRSKEQHSDSSIGSGASRDDEMVRSLIGRFWREVSGEDLQFKPPRRHETVDPSRAEQPSNGRGSLSDSTQVILEELFYQMISTHTLLEPPKKFGRMENEREPVFSTTEGGSFADPSTREGQEQLQVKVPGSVVPRYSDEELGLSRSPLTYSFEDGVAVLAGALRNNMHDVGRIADIMTRHFAPLIARSLGAENGPSPERVLDAAIALLTPLAHDPRLAGAVIETIPAMRRILGKGLITERQEQGFELPTTGEIQSLTALAVIASVALDGISRGREYEPWTTVYYHEILRMITLLDSEDLADPRSSMDRVLESAANNLVAGVGRLLQADSTKSEDRRAWEDLSFDLIRVSTLLADTRSVRSLEDINDVAREFGIETTDENGTPFPADRWSSRMSGLHMVTIPKLKRDHLILISLRYAVVGLLREALGLTQNTAAAFFNSGVELLRIDSHKQEVIPLRMIINGVGILGALRSTDDFAKAMTTNDGSDCLVNLLGSAADLVRETANDIPDHEVSRVLTVVNALLSAPIGISPSDGRRLQLAVDTLSQRGINASELGLGITELGLVVTELVNATCRALGISAQIHEEHSMCEMAPVVAQAYACVLPHFSDEIEADEPFDPSATMASYLTDFVRDIMSYPDDPYETLRQAYSGRFSETETVAIAGPLQVAGLQDGPTWSKTCDDALLSNLPLRAVENEIVQAFTGTAWDAQTPQNPAPPATAPGMGQQEVILPGAQPSDEPNLEELLGRMAQEDPALASALFQQLLQQAGAGEEE